jgi:hypothetical protein
MEITVVISMGSKKAYPCHPLQFYTVAHAKNIIYEK